MCSDHSTLLQDCGLTRIHTRATVIMNLESIPGNGVSGEILQGSYPTKGWICSLCTLLTIELAHTLSSGRFCNVLNAVFALVLYGWQRLALFFKVVGRA